MVKSKKKNNTKQAAFNPEKYLRTHGRTLHIGKCYKLSNTEDCGEISIMVTREHPSGGITFASYLLDVWCVGIKDSMWNFNVSPDEIDYLLSQFEEAFDTIEEIPYVEAHNWVYGAMEFAMEAGIKPCKDFALTRYVLEEDDEDVELIEYEYGRNGKHFLVANGKKEAAKYLPVLKSNLGEGNYECDIEADDFENLEEKRNLFLERMMNRNVKEIEYTYQSPEYPHYEKLNHPEIKDILYRKETDFTDSDLKYLLSLPADTLRSDLHSIILDELAWQRENDIDTCDDYEDHIYSVLVNVFIVLAGVGNINESLPLVLETLKMNKSGIDYYFGDFLSEIVKPIICVLIDGDVSLLMPFMFEPGILEYPKSVVAGVFELVGTNRKDKREEVIEQLRILLTRYREEIDEGKICNGSVIAFVIGAASIMGAHELIPEIEAAFATGKVDDFVEGDLQEVLERLHNPRDFQKPMPPTDPFKIQRKLTEILN